METVNNIYDLPGMPQAEAPTEAKASTTLIDYFGKFEKRVREGLPPQSVVSVTGLGWKPYLVDAAISIRRQMKARARL